MDLARPTKTNPVPPAARLVSVGDWQVEIGRLYSLGEVPLLLNEQKTAR